SPTADGRPSRSPTRSRRLHELRAQGSLPLGPRLWRAEWRTAHSDRSAGGSRPRVQFGSRVAATPGLAVVGPPPRKRPAPPGRLLGLGPREVVPTLERVPRLLGRKLARFLVLDEVPQVPAPLVEVLLLEGDPELAHVVNQARWEAEQEISVLEDVLLLEELFVD